MFIIAAGLGRTISKLGKSLGLDPAIFIPLIIGLIILAVSVVIIIGSAKDKKFLKYAFEEFKDDFSLEGIKATLDYNNHCYCISGSKFNVKFRFRCMQGIKNPAVYYFELTLPYNKNKDDFKKLPDGVLRQVKINNLKRLKGKKLECFLECKHSGVVPSKFLYDILQAYSEIINVPVWHYSLNGEDIGPLSDYRIQVLFEANVINNDTLVKKIDSEDWLPLANYL